MAAWTVWILLISAALTGLGSKAQDCGIAPLKTRIQGGEDATAESWPWQVSVYIHFSTFDFHICGGTLISDQWVLTAAHCILANVPSIFLLYFGRLTQSGPNQHEVNRTVSQIIVHPDYSAPYTNDIALMKLSSPVTFNDSIRPVCLASSSSQFHASTPCWITGWGKLGTDASAGTHNSLQEAQVPIIGNNQCSCKYRGVQNVQITDNVICAGEENKGACQGDSGGPLQCNQNSRWIQAGVTSFGIPCDQAGSAYPEGYMRVSQFQNWIQSQVAGANVHFVTFISSGTDPDTSFVCQNRALQNITLSGKNTSSTAVPTNVTVTTAVNTTSTTAVNTTLTTASTASTFTAQLVFVVIFVTVFVQHIVAP